MPYQVFVNEIPRAPIVPDQAAIPDQTTFRMLEFSSDHDPHKVTVSLGSETAHFDLRAMRPFAEMILSMERDLNKFRSEHIDHSEETSRWAYRGMERREDSA